MSDNPVAFVRALEQLHACKFGEGNLISNESNLSVMAKALGVPARLLSHEFQSFGNWLLLKPDDRVFMCELCLMRDFRFGRPPTARHLWSHLWFNVCLEHDCLLKNVGSVKPRVGLFNSLDEIAFLGLDVLMLEAFLTPEDLLIARRKSRKRSMFGKLKMMALSFQQWYMMSLRKGKFLIADRLIVANPEQFNVFMDDMLAIIGKKRRYPADSKSYIAQLLHISQWSSLSSNLSSAAGCERLLCADVGEHPPPVRMAMFALLGLFMKIPLCVKIYSIDMRGRGEQDEIAKLWWGMHSEIGVNKGYLAWLRERALSWPLSIRRHFDYLLASHYKEK